MLRISWMDSEYPADTPSTPEPELLREIIIRETVTETEPDSWVKWLTVINIVLWILFFMGAFDD